MERKVRNKPEINQGLNDYMKKQLKNKVYIPLDEFLKENPHARSFQRIFLPLSYACKPTSLSSPYRICINASFPGTNGLSYNSQNYKGSSRNAKMSELERIFELFE